MSLDVQGLHKLIDDWVAAQTIADLEQPVVDAPEAPARTLPEGQRVVRTPSSGDRVYLLDDVKKTRQWVTTEQILTALGFEQGDVTEVTDADLLKYQMASAIYRAPDATA